jgi:hypothetical protein
LELIIWLVNLLAPHVGNIFKSNWVFNFCLWRRYIRMLHLSNKNVKKLPFSLLLKLEGWFIPCSRFMDILLTPTVTWKKVQLFIWQSSRQPSISLKREDLIRYGFLACFQLLFLTFKDLCLYLAWQTMLSW